METTVPSHVVETIIDLYHLLPAPDSEEEPVEVGDSFLDRLMELLQLPKPYVGLSNKVVVRHDRGSFTVRVEFDIYERTIAEAIAAGNLPLAIEHHVDGEEDHDAAEAPSAESSYLAGITLEEMLRDRKLISVKMHACLRRYGLRTAADLEHKKDRELLEFSNFGRKSLEEVRNVIELLKAERVSAIAE